MEEQTKQKISKALKGQHHSKKTEFKKGHVAWSKGRIGKKYPTYKDGRGSFRRELKLSEADMNHCRICKEETYKINIHHIDGNLKNNNLKNLCILCSFCHNAIYDNGKETRFQKGCIPHNFNKHFVNRRYI